MPDTQQRDPRVQSTDPALEPGPDGRSLLQRRLSLYGFLLFALNLTFFVGYQETWANEPSVGPELARESTFSAAAILLAVTYLVIGLLPLIRGFSVWGLRLLDVVGHLSIGACCMGISLKMQVLSFGVYETLLALTGILSFRALLVPSQPAWTAFIWLVAALPSAVMVFGWSEQFAAPLVAPQTIRMIYTGRCLLILAFSTLASWVLYQLRRQVREA